MGCKCQRKDLRSCGYKARLLAIRREKNNNRNRWLTARPKLLGCAGDRYNGVWEASKSHLRSEAKRHKLWRFQSEEFFRVWWRRVRGMIPQVPEGTAHCKCAPLPVRVNPPLSKGRCGSKASATKAGEPAGSRTQLSTTARGAAGRLPPGSLVFL